MSATRDYYEGPDLVERVFGALAQAGLDTAALDVDALASLDEFHALGRAATIAMAARSDLHAGMRLLDAGAGIGGPARFLAAKHGVEVLALDVTERFCTLNERLCAATGLSGRVRVVCADATDLPFEDACCERAWTQALIQNLPDKVALLGELRRALVPGGLLSMFEVLRCSDAALDYPVPWADGPEESFLVGADELRELVEGAGFTVREWLTGPEAVSVVAEAAASVQAPAHDVDLSLLMPDYDARMAGVARNIGDGRIELAMAVLEAA